VRGKFQSVWLATSLLDASKYPAAEVVRLYAGRWRIETLFRELKVASGVRQELAAPVLELAALFEMMLERVAAAKLVQRPGRNEPRALTREWKHYPHLRVSRAEWRRRHAA